MSQSRIDVEKVKRVHLFSVLDQAQLQQVIKTTRVIRVEEGEQLFALGQQAEYFYVVISGQIKLFRVSQDGNEKIIDLLDAGRLFAEAVMFMNPIRYPVNATALRPTTLYAFRNQTYLSLLRQSNDLCFVLLGDLSMRLHILLNEIDQLTLQNATYRVVDYLLECLPDAHTESVVIDLDIPKQVIAARLSITPETFSRILRAMANEGIITIHGKTLGIHDIWRLREFGRSERAHYASLHK